MTILVLGSTGLVGRALVAQLRADHPEHTLILPTRSDLATTLDASIAPDVVMCCLGTTIKQAGSERAFRDVDHHLVIRHARDMRARGAKNVIVISAVGADASSRIFYSRVKGDMEHELATLGYPSVTILRPSLLLGKRTPSRPKEVALELLFRVVGPLIPRAWRGVHDHQVAHAMIDAMHNPRPGVRVITNAEIAP
jgi:uncharacterized protein YbjT (DUF2867 family)